jgi:hypothetical protein
MYRSCFLVILCVYAWDIYAAPKRRTHSLSDIKDEFTTIKAGITKLLRKSCTDPIIAQDDSETPENQTKARSILTPKEKKQQFSEKSSAKYLNDAQAANINQAQYLEHILTAIERANCIPVQRLGPPYQKTNQLEMLLNKYLNNKAVQLNKIPVIYKLNVAIGYITQAEYLQKWCNIPQNFGTDKYEEILQQIIAIEEKISHMMTIFKLSVENNEICNNSNYNNILRNRLKKIAMIQVSLAQTLARSKGKVKPSCEALNRACFFYNKATANYLDLAEMMQKTSSFEENERRNFCNQLKKAELLEMAQKIPELAEQIKKNFRDLLPELSNMLEQIPPSGDKRRKDFLLNLRKHDLREIAEKIPELAEQIKKNVCNNLLRKVALVEMVQKTPEQDIKKHFLNKYLQKTDLVEMVQKTPELTIHLRKHCRNQYLREIEVPREESVRILTKLRNDRIIDQELYKTYINLNKRFLELYPEIRQAHFENVLTI